MQINKPVANTDQHAADEISERDGEQISEKETAPVKPFRCDLECACGKNAGRDIEHIGNAVFISAQYENGDGKIKPDYLSHCGGCADRDPYGNAYENITENAP